jgi:hypothetical protein
VGNDMSIPTMRVVILVILGLGGTGLMIGAEQRHRGLAVSIVLSIWTIAGATVAVMRRAERYGFKADQYTSGVFGGAGIVLLCLLTAVLLVFILCTGLTGPMRFRE